MMSGGGGRTGRRFAQRGEARQTRMASGEGPRTDLDPPRPPSRPVSPWSPFRHPTFAVLWTATVAANVGTWMYTAASGWLMTGLNPDPLIVSLVQVAATLPHNLIAFEYPVADPAWWYDIVDGLPDPIVKGGMIDVWSRPGMGVELDPERARRYLSEEDAGFFD